MNHRHSGESRNPASYGSDQSWTPTFVGVTIGALDEKSHRLGGADRAGDQRKDESGEIGEHDPHKKFGRPVRSVVCRFHSSLSKALMMKPG